jgi:LPXTG-site transpeptidase (sortase) family protein
VPNFRFPLPQVLLALTGVLLAAAVGALAAGGGAPVERVNALAAGAPFTLEELRPGPPPPPAPVAVPLPTPVDPPEDPYAPEPAVVLGTIEIPRLGLVEPLNQGISLHSIDRGPSHWPGTALPGDPGNVVIAGHRATHTAPFRNIDQLQAGDAVMFTVDGERSTYRVTTHEVVTPDAMRIVEQTPASTATLFACHPVGSAKYRYVVSLALDEVVALSAVPELLAS